MKRIPPKTLDLAFVHSDCPMFADLIERLSGDTALDAIRIRDMCSGLRRVAKALGRAVDEVPADPKWLQPRLAKIEAAAIGLTVKSWQNALSDARTAMAQCGIVTRRASRIEDLSAPWQKLWRIVLDSADPTLPAALRRFVCFLSGQGVAPGEVCETHAIAFCDSLALNEISKSPETAYRAAVNGWNLAVRRIPAWPKNTISLPRRLKTYQLPEGTLPAPFLGEIDRLIDRLAHPDPLDPNGRSRPLRPDTLQVYRLQILRFAAELVHCGIAVDRIQNLHVLLDPTLAERGLRQMLSRNGNQTNRLIADTAGLLRNLARILDVPEEQRAQLTSLASRVAVAPQKGMTRKNRDRLRVLQDPDMLRRLLLLPERLFAQSKASSKRHTMALAREDAVAIAILLVCPVRIKTLSGIHLDLHLQRPGDGRGFLVFEESDIKNSRPIEFELPSDILRMIDRHLATRTPEICPKGTPWLFPRRDGKAPIVPNQLSARLFSRIRRETGLLVNAHLFRHLAVMIWLEANPGAYEAARRLLGHSELSHTLNLYSGLETRSAIQAFTDLITRRKGDLS